jgi:hypothetical protein
LVTILLIWRRLTVTDREHCLSANVRDGRIWAVALRGHSPFVDAQLGMLNAMVPFIAKSIYFSSGAIKTDDRAKQLEMKRLMYLQFAVDNLKTSDLITVVGEVPTKAAQLVWKDCND